MTSIQIQVKHYILKIFKANNVYLYQKDTVPNIDRVNALGCQVLLMRHVRVYRQLFISTIT